MGQLKSLLPWHGVPLVQYQVAAFLSAGASPVIVVVGHRREELTSHIPGQALLVVNHDYERGQSSSVKAGLLALGSEVACVAMLGVDQPRSSGLLNHVMQAHSSGGKLITRPTYAGRHGHPVVFSSSLLPELLKISEEKEGLREVVRRYAKDILDVESDSPEVLLNLNSPTDYRDSTGKETQPPCGGV